MPTAWLAVSSIAAQIYFVYHHIMDVTGISRGSRADDAVCGIAAAIGEPARARMLSSLMDGHARTSTELAVVAEVSPSTASAHLNRLKAENLVRMMVQGKHRYYSLDGPQVARVLEGLNILAGGCAAKDITHAKFVPSTPNRLRVARTCYDHLAGTAGVLLHDRLFVMQWLAVDPNSDQAEYKLTAEGKRELRSLGIDVDVTAMLRRRFAYACLDWSERRPHMGGGLAAALLNLVLKRKWLIRDLDSRALGVTKTGRRELLTRFGISV